jgi:anti-anti-sigma factor
MNLRLIERDGDVIRLAIEGEISHRMPSQDPVEALLGPGCFLHTVLIDLQKMPFLQSLGVSALLIIHKHFVEAGGRMILHSAPPQVNRVFQILHLPKIMNIAADEASALALARGAEG